MHYRNKYTLKWQCWEVKLFVFNWACNATLERTWVPCDMRIWINLKKNSNAQLTRFEIGRYLFLFYYFQLRLRPACFPHPDYVFLNTHDTINYGNSCSRVKAWYKIIYVNLNPADLIKRIRPLNSNKLILCWIVSAGSRVFSKIDSSYIACRIEVMLRLDIV